MMSQNNLGTTKKRLKGDIGVARVPPPMGPSPCGGPGVSQGQSQVFERALPLGVGVGRGGRLFYVEQLCTWHCLGLLQRSDRSAGKRDKKVLQGSPGLPDPALSVPAAREEADASTVKVRPSLRAAGGSS